MINLGKIIKIATRQPFHHEHMTMSDADSCNFTIATTIATTIVLNASASPTSSSALFLATIDDTKIANILQLFQIMMHQSTT